MARDLLDLASWIRRANERWVKTPALHDKVFSLPSEDYQEFNFVFYREFHGGHSEFVCRKKHYDSFSASTGSWRGGVFWRLRDAGRF